MNAPECPAGLQTDNTRAVVLIAVAAPAEARAVCRGLGYDAKPRPWEPVRIGGFEVLATGVGKSNAAGAVARFLDSDCHSGVLSVGVAGALPGGGTRIGDVVLADQSVFADEGSREPGCFRTCAEMGFPPGGIEGMAAAATPGWRTVLEPIADHVGGVACVSTCSGTDAMAEEVRERTGAIAEAMEGAAVGLAAARVAEVSGAAFGFAEIRVISNTTGDRAGQEWKLAAALDRLADVLGRVGGLE